MDVFHKPEVHIGQLLQLFLKAVTYIEMHHVAPLQYNLKEPFRLCIRLVG